MRRIIVVESRSHSSTTGDALKLARELLEDDGYTVRILSKGQLPKWQLNGTIYNPPQISLQVVMNEDEVTEGSVAEWLLENIKELVTRINTIFPNANNVYITLRQLQYSMYSSDEILVQGYVSVIVI